MKAVLQRVGSASVTVDGQTIAGIGQGLLVLLGIAKGDTEQDIQYITEKSTNLRIFESENGKLDHSVKDIDGEILLVSQFTLCGDCKKGRRPDFGDAAPVEDARELYQKAIKAFEKTGIVTRQGQFQAYMQVQLTNDGPVTIILDSKNK